MNLKFELIVQPIFTLKQEVGQALLSIITNDRLLVRSVRNATEIKFSTLFIHRYLNMVIVFPFRILVLLSLLLNRASATRFLPSIIWDNVNTL